MPSFTTETARYLALQTRDPLSHSAFVYAVVTTRIFCRPTCPARLARRANIRFYDSAADAAAAGFRPCKRCKPDDEEGGSDRDKHAAVVAKGCEMMKSAKAEGREMPGLEELAKGVGMSKWHFHRLFKRVMGVTPKAYAVALDGKQDGAEGEAKGPADAQSSTSTSTSAKTSTPALSEGMSRTPSTHNTSSINTPASQTRLTASAEAHALTQTLDFQTSEIFSQKDYDPTLALPADVPYLGSLDFSTAAALDGLDFDLLTHPTTKFHDLPLARYPNGYPPTAASSQVPPALTATLQPYNAPPYGAGYLLIALSDAGISYLDAGPSYDDLLDDFSQRFAGVNVVWSDYTRASFGVDGSGQGSGAGDRGAEFGVFEAVLSAMENRNGFIV